MLSKAESKPVTGISKVPKTHQDIVRRVEQIFADSAYFALRSVRCSYHEGVLILRGRVPSFYMKQVAQNAVRNVEQGIQIDNRLEVEPSQRQH